MAIVAALLSPTNKYIEVIRIFAVFTDEFGDAHKQLNAITRPFDAGGSQEGSTGLSISYTSFSAA